MFGIDLGDKERKLLPDELDVGKRVFKGTIKWWQVRISNGHGQGNSIFTNAGIGQDTIHVTKTNYAKVPNDILVHELAHVWQATNMGFTGWGYKVNSIAHQAYHMARGHGRNAAYTYDRKLLGERGWEAFSTEEQAQIVEDWFAGGEQKTDPAFRYIHHCIRNLRFHVGMFGMIPPPDVP